MRRMGHLSPLDIVKRLGEMLAEAARDISAGRPLSPFATEINGIIKSVPTE